MRKGIWKELGLLLLPVWKEDCKTFCPCHSFALSPPDRCPNGKYTVNTSPRSQIM